MERNQLAVFCVKPCTPCYLLYFIKFITCRHSLRVISPSGREVPAGSTGLLVVIVIPLRSGIVHFRPSRRYWISRVLLAHSLVGYNILVDNTWIIISDNRIYTLIISNRIYTLKITTLSIPTVDTGTEVKQKKQWACKCESLWLKKK